jgi:hypothetical protein
MTVSGSIPGISSWQGVLITIIVSTRVEVRKLSGGTIIIRPFLVKKSVLEGRFHESKKYPQLTFALILIVSTPPPRS